MRLSPASLIVVATTCLMCLATSQADSLRYAPVMPLAPKSLLLDITEAGTRLVVAGERGHILYSDDDGQRWQQAMVPTTQMLTSVYFLNSQRGWAVGHDGLILVSDDSGENWRIQRDGLAVQYQTNLELREVAHRQLKNLQQRLEAADPEIRSQLEQDLEDAQMNLEDAEFALAEPTFTAPLMDVWFQDASRGWAVGAFGTLVTTVDGGQYWVNNEKVLANPDELHLNTITGDGKGRVFVAGEGGVMFRSLDGGRSWKTLEPFYEGSWFGAVYNAGNDTLFIFGLRGNLYRSNDFGTSWKAVFNDNTSTLAGGSASTGNPIVLAGGAGAVLFSTDGGQSFQLTLVEDRLGLSSGLGRDGKLILVGQGGIKVREVADHAY
tara:strand:+ start:160513 stop:161649 length:1137 start_codon:yes stop_codon:yes gene_type:complete